MPAYATETLHVAHDGRCPGFLDGLGKRRIVLDEICRLPNLSELLKIAADHYPNIQVLAMGSSTLVASAKFKDRLAGRMKPAGSLAASTSGSSRFVERR